LRVCHEENIHSLSLASLSLPSLSHSFPSLSFISRDLDGLTVRNALYLTSCSAARE
jgi:hypothetical protein